MDAELLELMPDTVQWLKKATSNLRGEATYEAGVPVQCLYDDTTSQVAGFDGRIVNAVGTVYCGGVYAIEPEHAIETPAGAQLKPVQIRQLHDEDGPYATVVYLGV
jgi:hypothetical protein